jgi:hypothetical protein
VTRTNPPTELDRLDPPPRPPRPPRRPRHRAGKVEKSVAGYLKTLPDRLQNDPVAVAARLLASQLDDGLLPAEAADSVLGLARQLEEGGLEPEDAAARLRSLADQIAGSMSARDAAGHAREMRMCITQLRDWNPGGETGDATDAAREQVEAVGGLYAVPEA